MARVSHLALTLTLLVVLVGLLVGPSGMAFAQAAKAPQKVIAVFPFDSPSKYHTLGRNAQSTFITKLVNTKHLKVIQSRLVERMLRKHGLSYTGTIDKKLLKAAGKWLKADYVLAGKLRWGGDAYVLSAHVMNVRSLETVFAEDVDFRHLGKMRIASRVLAKKIAGSIIGAKAEDSGAVETFLNINPRAFHDTVDALIGGLESIVGRRHFSGTVEEVNEGAREVLIKGHGTKLDKGTALDIYNTSGVDGPQKVATVYVSEKRGGTYVTTYRSLPEDGIELGAQVNNQEHQWVVAIGSIADQVEDNETLVREFKKALKEKLAESEQFTAFSGAESHNKRKLASQGAELLVEGKFYGSAGRRRAHFKIYATLSGKLWAEPKFETSL